MGGEYDNDAYRYAPLRRYMRLHGRGLGMFNVRSMGDRPRIGMCESENSECLSGERYDEWTNFININRTGMCLVASFLRQPNSSRAGVVGSFVLFFFNLGEISTIGSGAGGWLVSELSCSEQFLAALSTYLRKLD